jgi:hypothetical protein
MRPIATLILAAALLPGLSSHVKSGRVGVYAIVESVAFEPVEGPPQRIQLRGAFAFTEQLCGDCMFPGDHGRSMVLSEARRGVMYFALPEQSAGITESVIEAIRREWADIRSVAGTGQAIAFGSWRFAGDIDLLIESMQMRAGNSLFINGKRVMQIWPDSLGSVRIGNVGEVRLSAAPSVYETNVGVVRLTVRSHNDVIRQLRDVLKGEP